MPCNCKNTTSLCEKKSCTGCPVNSVYHYTYETINNINGKVYVGVHTTDNLNDGYMGSGKLLKQAMKKHGKASFTKNIINFHPTREDALTEEKVIVNRNFVEHKWNYNIFVGGGGFPYGQDHPFYGKFGKEHNRYGHIQSEDTRKKIGDAQRGEKNHFYGRKVSEEWKKQMSKYVKKYIEENGHPLCGKKPSEETRRKISEAIKGRKLTKKTKNRMSQSSHKSRPVQHIPTGVFYKSLTEACDVMDIDFEMAAARLRRESKLNEFKRI